MGDPTVSILMSVFNGEEYLRETMDSIQTQTFTDWECMIVDDCSTDQTAEILQEYAQKDSRFQIVTNEKNMRIAGSLNRVIPMIRGKYAVRMDADDISRLDRLEKQTAFMDRHPELSMSCCKWFNLSGDALYPVAALRRNSPDLVRGLFLFFNPIVHSGLIIRTEVLQKYRYNPEFFYTEDLELWTRILMGGGKIAVQDEFLLLYRVHENQVTSKYQPIQKKQYQEIVKRMYSTLLFELNEIQLVFLTEKIYYRDSFSPSEFGTFLEEILKANRQKRDFSERSVRYAAFEFLLTRRSLAENKTEWLRQIMKLGIRFSIKELFQRKEIKRLESRKCQSALLQFGREQEKTYTKEKNYWNV